MLFANIRTILKKQTLLFSKNIIALSARQTKKTGKPDLRSIPAGKAHFLCKQKKTGKPGLRSIPAGKAHFLCKQKRQENPICAPYPQAKPISSANKKRQENPVCAPYPQAKPISSANKKKTETRFLRISVPVAPSAVPSGAENGIRTRDPHLGKVVLYH